MSADLCRVFIDAKGDIREKFFEAKYRERLSRNNVIAKLFPELGEQVTNTVEAPNLQLMVGQSDRAGFPGSRITLTAEVRLPPRVHVYAPGTKGYKPINLLIDPMPEVQLRAAVYPRSKILYLPAIKPVAAVCDRERSLLCCRLPTGAPARRVHSNGTESEAEFVMPAPEVSAPHERARGAELIGCLSSGN